jgi:hypothetical protein
VFFRLKTDAAVADSSRDSYGVGLTAIILRLAEHLAPGEDSGATYPFVPCLPVVHDPAFHAAGDRDDLPRDMA